MAKLSITVAILCVLMLSASSASYTCSSANLSPIYSMFDHAIETNKRKKNKQLPPEAQEMLKPVLQLKQAIESELPQKELNTIKRLAFKVLILARKFL